MPGADRGQTPSQQLRQFQNEIGTKKFLPPKTTQEEEECLFGGKVCRNSHVTRYYVRGGGNMDFGVTKRASPLTKNYSGVGGRTSNWTPVADKRKELFGSLKPNFL